MHNEHLRAIVWPREIEVDGKKFYKYPIVGMLITDTPIENLNHNQNFINQGVFGFKDMIETMSVKEIKFPLGDANSVLTSLDELSEMIEDYEERLEEEF